MLLVLLSACGSNTTGSGAVATPTPKPLTVKEQLQKSSDAMKKFTSVHFVMNMGEDMARTGAQTGAGQTTISLQGSGDLVGQDKTSMDLSVGLGAIQIKLSAILLSDKVYVKSTKQWYVLDSKNATGITSLTGSQDYSKFLDLAAKAKYVDHGVETYSGERLHHITFTFGKDAIADMFDALGQSSTLTADQKKAIDQFSLTEFSMDTWTDDATSYLHHIQMKMGIGMGVNTQGTPVTTGTASTSTMNINTTFSVDFSNFNKPVTITAPANAIPTDNVNTIFG